MRLSRLLAALSGLLVVAANSPLAGRSLREAALRDEATRLETLNRIGQELAAIHDLDEVVKRVCDAATALTSAEIGLYFTYADGETKYVVCGATVERSTSSWPARRCGSRSSSTVRMSRMSISMWLNAGVPSVSTIASAWAASAARLDSPKSLMNTMGRVAGIGSSG